MIARIGMRWRLVAWVSAAMVCVCAVVFVVVYQQTGSQLRAQVAQDTRDDVTQLSEAVRTLHPLAPGPLAHRLRRYVGSQPYSRASALLFAVVPGHGTISNYRELFGSARPDNGETGAQQQLENRQGHELLVGAAGSRTVRTPDVGMIQLDERVLTIAGHPIRIGAGESLLTVTRAQRSVARAFLLAGALALALMLIASYLAGGLATRPIRRLASVAARVGDGDLHPRMHVSDHAAHEIQTLANSFNGMLDRLAAAFSRQREFVADASHELRTPLTVIAGQLEVLGSDPDPSPADIRRAERLAGAEISRISRLVDDMLLLTRADHADFLHRAPIDLETYIADLWETTTRQHERRFTLGPVPDLVLDADPDRLAQALRNLIDNAVAHTRAPDGRVSLSITAAHDRIRFTVADDGPGIPAAEHERVFNRFHRIDSARDRGSGGSGLGLAIVAAIAAAHGGSVRVADSEIGARLALELPLASRAPAGTEPVEHPSRASSRAAAL
ncbi:MAG TPA: HAMP domain-containing sensor histidine kinase [Solirubrobacteraceae bacterium]|nr:HAMP domain-containing sensor histidine kinase [Solirubrobacteraceae bacterium]